MPRNKVKGLIGKDIYGGLVGSIIRHTDGHKLYLEVTAALLTGENPAEVMRARRDMLEKDMTTMYNTLKEILDIAKQKGYEERGYGDIIKIIEDREYEHGHNARK